MRVHGGAGRTLLGRLHLLLLREGAGPGKRNSSRGGRQPGVHEDQEEERWVIHEEGRPHPVRELKWEASTWRFLVAMEGESIQKE